MAVGFSLSTCAPAFERREGHRGVGQGRSRYADQVEGMLRQHASASLS